MKQKGKAIIKEWDYFGINEINIIVEIEGKKFNGCLTELGE